MQEQMLPATALEVDCRPFQALDWAFVVVDVVFEEEVVVLRVVELHLLEEVVAAFLRFTLSVAAGRSRSGLMIEVTS